MSDAVVGTLRWNEFEGGFWSIEPDSGESAFVLPDWTPPAPFVDGSRVSARIQVREEQMGFLMAGTYADVLEFAALD
jgi:hypothetical protein